MVQGGICVGGRWNGMYGSCSQHKKDQGYTIISAEEYLGREEVFKVGDKVECVKVINSSFLKIGSVYTIAGFNGSDLRLEEAISAKPDHSYDKSQFRKTTKDNQTKTIKSEEVKMPLEINKNIIAEFGGENGNDMLLVDKHYNKDVIERILIKKYHAEIMTACKEAEKSEIKARDAAKKGGI